MAVAASGGWRDSDKVVRRLAVFGRGHPPTKAVKISVTTARSTKR